MTRLTASSVKANAESYQFVDAPGSGISRVRSVLVLKDPDLMVLRTVRVDDGPGVPDAVASAGGSEGGGPRQPCGGDGAG